MSITKVNLTEKFGLFQDQWHPKIAAQINDTHLKLVKVQGEFVWHHHGVEDELFLVVRGNLRIELRDGAVDLSKGEFAVIPHGVEHRPVAEQECWIVLLEPAGTVNTGNVSEERTRGGDTWI